MRRVVWFVYEDSGCQRWSALRLENMHTSWSGAAFARRFVERAAAALREQEKTRCARTRSNFPEPPEKNVASSLFLNASTRSPGPALSLFFSAMLASRAGVLAQAQQQHATPSSLVAPTLSRRAARAPAAARFRWVVLRLRTQ